DLHSIHDTATTHFYTLPLHDALPIFGIKKPLVSYYKPKEREGARRVLASLERGDEVALVTDAGMPCISDPGALLVKEARDAGFEDRKSTRLNSSHVSISYAVFCLKKK